jgi:hypothetical protein
VAVMNNRNFETKTTIRVSYNTLLDRTKIARLGPLKPDSSSFQEITEDRNSDNIWTEDHFSSLLVERLRDEALEEADDLQLAVECEQELVETNGLYWRIQR